MSDAPDEEQQILEANLSKALDEAWSKANKALEMTAKGTEGFEKEIWAAAEAAEYSSLLFSLTYDLEDVDPPSGEIKGDEPLALVKESIEALRRTIDRKEGSHLEAYQNLRNAVQSLKTAYLDRLKKRGRSK